MVQNEPPQLIQRGVGKFGNLMLVLPGSLCSRAKNLKQGASVSLIFSSFRPPRSPILQHMPTLQRSLFSDHSWSLLGEGSAFLSQERGIHTQHAPPQDRGTGTWGPGSPGQAVSQSVALPSLGQAWVMRST